MAEWPRYMSAAAMSSLWLSSTVTLPRMRSRYLGSKIAAQVSVGTPSSCILCSL